MTSNNPLRCGITTGTTTAGASKAAALALTGALCCDIVTVTLTNGEDRTVKIEQFSSDIKGVYGAATAIKDAGDDPDVTDGIRITARINLACSEKGTSCSSNSFDDVIVKGGSGVGIVTKPGLQVPVGSHAINPVPLQMIRQAVRQILPHGRIIVEISVINGEEIAKKTFNERLGIIGGISILGTTGIVTPMSHEAIKATIKCEIDVAYEEMSQTHAKMKLGGYNQILYLSPGHIGEMALKKITACLRVVQFSNYIGYALSYAADKGISEIVIGGHPGKLAKILMGYWDTHSGRSPQAVDFVAEFLGITKLKGGINQKFNTVEEIIGVLDPSNRVLDPLIGIFDQLAREIAYTIINKYIFNSVTVYLFDMKKRMIGKGVCTI